MSPEALRRRMAHGNIYAPEKVDAALGNYFRVGNLAALRELALLWVADRVDEALQDYRRAPRHRRAVGDHGAGRRRPHRRAGRRARSSGGRPAWRMRAKGELLGVHVARRRRAGRGRRRTLLDAAPHAARASSAARYHEVAGADVAAALVDFARAENATQLVLGRQPPVAAGPSSSRGSVINRRHRAWPRPIDVHVIHDRRPATDERPPATLPPRPPARRRSPAGAGLAAGRSPLVGLPAAHRSCCANLRIGVGLPSGLLLYLLLVVAVAAVGGVVPGPRHRRRRRRCSANWFFTPPLRPLRPSSGRERRSRSSCSSWSAAVGQRARRAAPPAAPPTPPGPGPRPRRWPALAGRADRRRRPAAGAASSSCGRRSTSTRSRVLRRATTAAGRSRPPPATRPTDARATATRRRCRCGDDASWCCGGRASRRGPAASLSAFVAQLGVGARAPPAPGRGRRAPTRWPRPTSCAPRCSQAVSATTCARRWRRSRPRPRACSQRRRRRGRRARPREFLRRPSTRRPTGSTRSSATCST